MHAPIDYILIALIGLSVFGALVFSAGRAYQNKRDVLLFTKQLRDIEKEQRDPYTGLKWGRR